MGDEYSFFRLVDQAVDRLPDNNLKKAGLLITASAGSFPPWDLERRKHPTGAPPSSGMTNSFRMAQKKLKTTTSKVSKTRNTISCVLSGATPDSGVRSGDLTQQEDTSLCRTGSPLNT